MFRTITAIFMALIIAFTTCITPASAYNMPTDFNIEPITTPITTCLLKTPENGIQEIGCDFLKMGIEAGLVVGFCYGADMLASSAFPPLASLAPFCNYLGIAPQVKDIVKKLDH